MFIYSIKSSFAVRPYDFFGKLTSEPYNSWRRCRWFREGGERASPLAWILDRSNFHEIWQRAPPSSVFDLYGAIRCQPAYLNRSNRGYKLATYGAVVDHSKAYSASRRIWKSG
ncbi:hypothetical protein SELMODRAFT_404542 [Selaginella moellendorffii]|uniref:Uncharacterized protein n=1 Tax=Selaginella moellendorffii TaxID=88036 RepID=D8QVN8_SELML|nr:hypothetical protein SELMODRAFT_404542 [Selaginella moellendorffii]